MLQLTEDHSLVNELVKSGRLLVRWLQIIHEKCPNTFFGNARTVEVDVTNHEWLPNDYLLLCSDGLTNMVPETKF